ncbi:hypothetical protein [Pseudomonas sp. VLB120]|uniref:hypothetical protein n=1 Tax=Pseudomonas sp. VLB120 TaxID=69328 RepID=UPI0004221424|nr:hypothetical protein [Pseudomonas sp. VLB120]
MERAAALLASILANQGRNAKLRPEPFTPADFCPHDDRQAPSLEQAMEEWS